MPRKQVYGKRAGHVYSSFAAFTSPTKSRKESKPVEVLEIADQFQGLTVYDGPTIEEKKTGLPLRSPLAERHGNEAGRKPRTYSGSKGTDDIAEVQRPSNQAADVLQDTHVRRGTDKDTVKKSQTIGRPVSPELVEIGANQGPRNPDSPRQRSDSASPAPTTCAKPASSTVQSVDEKVPVVSNVYTEYLSSLLSLSSRPLLSFEDWSEQLSCHFKVNKIAEASFGEVYRLSLLRAHPALGRADESVLKVIALKAPPSTRKKLSKAAKKRLEMMSDPADVASEVRLMQRMTTIPGYTMFRDCCLLQGRPGASFTEAWQDWNQGQQAKGKDTSVFPDPGKRGSYNNNQLWAVIEMQDAGTDLENADLKDIWATWDVFWGVVLALGKGEEHVGFEHRDLHMGNICVTKRHDDRLGRGNTRINPRKNLGYTGIETTLIDYTISRAVIAPASAEADEDIAFLDLEKDLTLFEGDAEEEYQYEIYRHMRAVMYLDDPLADLWERWDEAESSGRTWKGFHPQTNLVWLHFILAKLLEQLEWPSSNFSSEDDDTVVEKANQLEHAFVRLDALLDPRDLPNSGLRAAGDLVKLAIAEGWLSEEDVRGAPAVPTIKEKKKKKNSRTARGRPRE